ncbi:hypothetical protein ACL03H_14575 [Saccharopolyspora sp. MS10]|uniref:hypothetical protein n=1 Tax=Saccharopolyspora sp. MS10 TaxID=3385973 RepID=UPI0039A108FA
MNETELEQLFKNAAGDAPEASFGTDDVVRGSRRVTARRRTALAGGSLVAAAVLVGGVGVGTGLLGQAGSPVAQPPAEPTQSPMALPNEQPGTGTTPRSGPITLGDPMAADGCGPADAALSAALRERLPESAGTTPTGARGSCPIGARTAAVPIREGATAGKISVMVSPRGSRPAPTEGRAANTAVAEVPTASGRTLTVLSEPEGSARAPFADRVPVLADELAPRF